LLVVLVSYRQVQTNESGLIATWVSFIICPAGIVILFRPVIVEAPVEKVSGKCDTGKKSPISSMYAPVPDAFDAVSRRVRLFQITHGHFRGNSMNLQTRILLSASAAFLGILGVGASFLPQELLSYSGTAVTGFTVVLVQIAGALYLGFAMQNWMSRSVTIGGIYARPLALGNFLHFMVASIVLVKYQVVATAMPVLAGTVVYAVFAAWFGLVLFTHPLSREG
jgi:hypothetical protein